ncbi:hypothetical protein JWG42_00460 [Desulfoprunum benzoelyticum]|uniref:Uncharacterized protein n=1 Tax=Desulfoprunum benzoelyticum TaxID=1506996 RepID=A0A840UNG8_9BACT|nr:hypothetical protein [Desulfoprunum benzoelyticum]MBB5346376.1 hypothetical protein [Desulfoprunum benzoelyticum]MBM9528625.1 hypothetical protein [Desulfoprunum benzoelyticum]
MTALPTQLPGERVKKALVAYCEMKQNHPERDRRSLLEMVETRFDLTPLECEFLNRQILEEGK